jgi:hypothetical protein
LPDFAVGVGHHMVRVGVDADLLSVAN